jgi:hypothetical protein
MVPVIGPARVEPRHQRRPAAKSADRHAAADIFAEGGQIRPDAKRLL